MNILINAISIKEGGSLVVLDRLLGGMSRLEPGCDWHVIVDAAQAERFSGRKRVGVHAFPWMSGSPAALAYFYEVTLLRLVARLKPSVLFSQTNYLPRRRLPCPTLLLIQNAGHFSPAFARLTEEAAKTTLAKLAWRYKTRWVHASARSASRVTVQTAALADAVAQQAQVPYDRINIVPHGPGLLGLADGARTFPHEPEWRIGYVTKYGVQKNFPVLLKALARLRRKGIPAKLILTLGAPSGSPESFAALNPLIEQLGIGDAVENRGELAWECIGPLYDSLDVFVFPSICESFGFPMVEAMSRGLPILVADTPENLETAGPGAIAFQPDDDAALALHLQGLMQNPSAYEAQSARSLDRAGHYAWSKAAAATLGILQELSAKPAERAAKVDWSGSPSADAHSASS